MHPDFLEMLSALYGTGADYLVVGAHALAAHGRPRATGDLDLWVRPTPQNADRVYRALQQFGAPLGRTELIRNKRASGRPRDLADLAELEE